MAKKKKLKKKRESEKNTNTISEEKAYQDLEFGRCKQARAAFRKLLELDREKFLKPLLECSRMLTTQLIGKKQLAQAATVINEIKTLNPAENVDALEFRLLLSKEDWHVNVAQVANYLLSSAGKLGQSELLLAADKLVVLFCKNPGVIESSHVLHRELTVVRESLVAISEERYEDASILLRVINSKSVISHWRVFLKGLIAFYTCDDNRAVMCFAKLPKKSMLKQVSLAFLSLLEEKIPAESKSELRQIQSLSCLVAGHPELKTVLPRADYLWRVKRYGDSLKEFYQGVSDFSTQEPQQLWAKKLFP